MYKVVPKLVLGGNPCKHNVRNCRVVICWEVGLVSSQTYQLDPSECFFFWRNFASWQLEKRTLVIGTKAVFGEKMTHCHHIVRNCFWICHISVLACHQHIAWFLNFSSFISKLYQNFMLSSFQWQPTQLSHNFEEKKGINLSPGRVDTLKIQHKLIAEC
jgi:hypothetical protein